MNDDDGTCGKSRIRCVHVALVAVLVYGGILGMATTTAQAAGPPKATSGTSKQVSMIRTTKNGKPFAAVIDIFPQLCLVRNDMTLVDREIELLAEFGFQRLYFVVCLPGYPSFSNPWITLQAPDNDCHNHSLESIVALDSPNWAFCRCAKKHGLEAFAIFKPYEGGGGATVPSGARIFWEPGGRYPGVGGDRIQFDALLARHPELRVQRKPIPHYEQRISQPFTAVELTFCLDEIPGNRRARSVPAAPADYRCEDHPVTFTLWQSENNAAYHPVEGRVTIRETIEMREVRDVNGMPLFDDPRRCRVVRFTDLDLSPEVNYLGITIKGDPVDVHRLQTIPTSMFAVFGPDGKKIPTTTSLHARNGISRIQSALPPDKRLWGLEGQPRLNSMRFRDWGFEFGWHGGDIWFGQGWHADKVYGIGRGTIMTMKGTHCEAYPEVRAYWLAQIQRLIDMGFDGVDIRLQNHSSMVADYANYGFNPPLVKKYREVYGDDPINGHVDPLRMMAVRGRFFQQFLAEAADLLHRNGRKLQMHLRHAHEDPKLSGEFNQLGFWAMPKIWLEDWRGVIDLADEITIKDYYFGHYDPANAGRIKAYAQSQGKPVWIHDYVSQGDGIRPEFIDAVDADPTVNGILLYEVFHTGRSSNEPNQGLISVVKGRMSWYRAARKALLAVSTLSPQP